MDTRRLESRIASLRASVRRLLALHGLGWVVGLVLPLVVLAGLADWFFHVDSLVRLTFLTAISAFALWALARFVVRPLVVKFPDLDIAMRIEERWPGLNDRLTSTVQFLKAPATDERYGSVELRQATVLQTLKETETIDFRAAVEPRPVYRALGAAASALGIALLVVALDPALAGIAARRLFLPFGSDVWPRQTHLTLLDEETPRRVARGEPFTVGVAIGEGERTPAVAKATYVFENGETATESLRSVEGGVFRGRIEAVERSFTFSVSAGDDSTSINDVAVAVVPPPAIRDLTIRLVAPEYTKLAPQTLAQGKTQVRAVVGTRVEIDALANKPIETASLNFGEKLGASAVSLDRARTKLATTFVLGESTPFWFELLDAEGFRNRDVVRHDARSVRDEPPRVVIDDPSNDRDVPAKATVPVTFTVDDDFGIHSARLVYRAASGGSEPLQEVVLPLWDASDAADGPPVKHQQVRYEWDLAPLNLPPGSVISFHADARDFDTVNGPNLGKSRELRLRILADEDIVRELDDARRAIREDIEAILNMQNQARTPVDEAIRTLEQTNRLSKTGRENLDNAGMIQRQVGNRVTNKADGLEQKIGRFLEDLENFKIPSPDARKQMEDMRGAVARIRDNHLEPAEQGLSRASKNLDQQEGKAAEGGKDPSPAARQPDSDRASAPSGKQGASPSKDQAASKSGTSKGGASKGQTSKGDSSKSDSSKGDPSKGDSSKGDSSKGDSSKDASSKGAQSRKPSAGSDSGEAAKESLEQAGANQKEIADELEKMLEGLSEFETAREVVKDAQNLLKEHEQAMKQTAEQASKPELMTKTPDQLSPEQKADLANLSNRQESVAKKLQELQNKMRQMAGKLEDSDPLGASAMREAADQAEKRGTAGKLGDAADQLGKNQMGAARSNQEQAREDLKELVDSIQNRRERELARLVRELKEAEAELKKLNERQTQNLEKTRRAQKNPDAKQRGEELKKLAKEQEQIKKQLDSQLKKLAKLNAEAAARAASRASGKMGQAQKGLEQDQGEQADQNQEDALADLEQAEEEAREARKEAEEQLAMEQLFKMGDHLKSLAERQKKVVNDTVDYERLRTKNGDKLTLAQRSGVKNLAGVQEALEDETAELIAKLEGAPVFALTLKRASTGMETTARRLMDFKTDEPTQRAASSAAGRLDQLLESLKPDTGKNGGPQPQQPGGGGWGGGGGGGGGDGIPPAAQIKMLKALQLEINDRTEFFDELARRNKALTREQSAELESLHQDQGTLADLVRDLTKPKRDDAEE